MSIGSVPAVCLQLLQKRSKHYVRFGRSPIDIDAYIYDDGTKEQDDDVADADQSSEFISRRSPRRHYVRFGRDGGRYARHYVRFGRKAAAGAAGNALADPASKRAARHYVRFGRDQTTTSRRQKGGAEKRVHYVRFGRNGELGQQRDSSMTAGSDDDRRRNEIDKRPNYVRFG